MLRPGNSLPSSKDDRKVILVTVLSPQYLLLSQGSRPSVMPAILPTAVFGISIESVMEKQKVKFPELPVPQVILVLFDLLRHMNGMFVDTKNTVAYCVNRIANRGHF